MASTLARKKAETDLQQIRNEEQIYFAQINKDIKDQLFDLETQIAIETAITDQMRQQVELEARLKQIQDGPGTQDQKDALKDAERRLQQAREGNQGISGYMKQLQSELMDTEAIIVSLAQTVETELASAMSSAITGLIDGTQTAQEAFASMFRNIANAFINMATQMIANALFMKALGILIPGAESTTGQQSAAVQAGWPGNLNYEGGGFTGSGNRVGGLDGKGGFMAMLHPNETVIDHTRGGGVMGGDTTVNITINENGNSTSNSSGTNAKEAAQLARLIENSTMAVINREKRPGGSLSR